MTKTKFPLIFFLLVLLLCLTPFLVTSNYAIVHAQGTYEEEEEAEEATSIYKLVTERDLYFQGYHTLFNLWGYTQPLENVDITFYRNGGFFYETSVQANEQGYYYWSRPLAQIQTGIYEVRAVFQGGMTISRGFTYFRTDVWNTASFPIVTEWKNVYYWLGTNRTLICTRNNERITLAFPDFTGFTQSFYVNNMGFKAELTKSDATVEFYFIRSHAGLKILLKGTQSKARIFRWQISAKRLERMFRGLRSGNLCFDWLDLEKDGVIFTYQNGHLYVFADTEFYLDPTIFTEGFEGGDKGEFDWIQTTGGESVEFPTAGNPAFGSYHANHTSDGSADYENAYLRETFASSYSTFHVRFYVKFNDLNHRNEQPETFLSVRNDTNGIQQLVSFYDNGTDVYWRLRYRDGGVYVDMFNATPNIVTGVYYCVETRIVVDGSSGESALWVDGVKVLESTGYDSDDRGNIDEFYVGIFNHRNDMGGTTRFIDQVECATEYIGTVNTAPNTPTLDSPLDDATEQPLSVNLNVTYSDPEGDSGTVWFFNNGTGAYLGNDTGVLNNTIASYTWTGLSYATTYHWHVIANDGSLNSSIGGDWGFTTMSDITIPPYITVVGFNTTVGETVTRIDLAFGDDSGLSHYILGHNASGSWANVTWRSLTGTSDTSNENVTLPSLGVQFGVRVYCNDTDNVFAEINTISFPVSGEIATFPTGYNVSTGNEWHMIGYTPSRHTFYFRARHWVFYYNNSWIVYRSSIDQITWSSEGQAINVGVNGRGSYTAIHFDGIYVHVTAFQGSASGNLYYRRGQPFYNASIRWSTDTQTVVDFDANEAVREQSLDITVDSDRIPFISYTNDTAINENYPLVLRGQYDNGTWGLNATMYLSSVDNGNWRTDLTRVSNGSVYVVYWITGTSTTKGRYFNGTSLSWSSEQTITTGSIHQLSVVGDNDNEVVHLAYNDNDMKYQYYNVSTSTWTGTTTIDTTPILTDYPLLSRDRENSQLYLFYGSFADDIIYTYNRTWGGSWSSRYVYANETTLKLSWTNYLHSSEESYGGVIGVFYMTKDFGVTPYQLKYLALFVTPSADEWETISVTTIIDIIVESFMESLVFVSCIAFIVLAFVGYYKPILALFATVFAMFTLIPPPYTTPSWFLAFQIIPLILCPALLILGVLHRRSEIDEEDRIHTPAYRRR